MNIELKECKGCIHKDSRCLIWRHRFSIPDLKCPCMDCILKMICTQICEARVEAYFKLGEFLGSRESNNDRNPT